MDTDEHDPLSDLEDDDEDGDEDSRLYRVPGPKNNPGIQDRQISLEQLKKVRVCECMRVFARAPGCLHAARYCNVRCAPQASYMMCPGGTCTQHACCTR